MLPQTSTDPLRTVSAPEAALLLCCARTSMDSENTSRIKELTRNGLNWNDVLRLARPHGMMPLLYWHLHQICPESVPPPTLAKLRDHFHENSRRNLFFVAELLELLNLFEKNGIPAIPYKGPVLAASIYGNVSLRQFGDLDILVPKSQALKASDLLLLRGYRPRVQLRQIGHEAVFLDAQCELNQVRADRNIAVEVHWEIAPRYMVIPIDLSQLRQRLVPVSFAGTTVFSFPPEDLLLILCVHGTKHCWERLDWICGVSELVRRYREIDWPRVVEQADMLGAQRMLFLGLFLARDLLGSEVPAEVQEQIDADRAVKSLAERVRRCLFDRPAEPPSVFVQSFFHLRAKERLRDKIRYGLRLVTTPNQSDWQVVNLPGTLHFLYYVIRAVRLVVRHGPVLLNDVVRLLVARHHASGSRPAGPAVRAN